MICYRVSDLFSLQKILKTTKMILSREIEDQMKVVNFRPFFNCYRTLRIIINAVKRILAVRMN